MTPADVRADVLKTLINGPLTRSEIAVRTGLPDEKVSSALRSLHKEGAIRRNLLRQWELTT